MNRIDNDVMRITRSANPVPDEVVGGSVQGDEAQDLLARIAQPPTPEPRPGNWIRFGIPAAVSMAVVIALLSVSLVRGGPGLPGITSPGGPETSAGSPVVLERIAAVAAMQPEITLPPGGFRYTKSEARYMSTTIHSQDNSYSVLESTIREIWVAEDGEGRLRTEVGDVEFLTDRDRRAWEAAGSPPLRRDTVSDDRFPGGDPGGTDLYFENFDGLSTDPDEVYRVVEERSRNQGITLHQEMFDMVGALLRETNAPPEIRSALFRAAAKIPGMEVKENVTDPKGRPGIALSLTYDPGGRMIRNELVFDPDTSALLAESHYVMERSPNDGPTGRPDKPAPANAPPAAAEVDVYGELPPGTQIGGAVYLESGIVNSVEERPGG